MSSARQMRNRAERAAEQCVISAIGHDIHRAGGAVQSHVSLCMGRMV